MKESLAVWFGSASALVAATYLGWRTTTKWWRKAVKPKLGMVEEIFLILRGRPEIRLPEDPDTVIAPAVPGALDRLTAIEGTLAEQQVKIELLVNRTEGD